MTYEVVCDVCGEEGVACKHVAYSYRGIRHRNPEVCAENLARRKEELDRRQKKIEEAEEGL